MSASVGGHRARKRYGQNFLVDRTAIGRIIAAIDPQPGDHVVEIGPGLGALTEPLLARLASLEVIEVDRDLAARLAARWPAQRLRVHVADALEFDFARLGTRLRVVGNLPYNISSPILFRLCEATAAIADIHVMLQKEVVDRMIARPGTRDYGRLSVMLAYRFRIERLLRVAAGAFRPAPRVESAFARLTPHDPLPWPARDEPLFARIVAAAFGQRRKTLHNALREFADDEALRAAGVDPRARGETLSVQEFVALSNRLAGCAAA